MPDIEALKKELSELISYNENVDSSYVLGKIHAIQYVLGFRPYL